MCFHWQHNDVDDKEMDAKSMDDDMDSKDIDIDEYIVCENMVTRTFMSENEGYIFYLDFVTKKMI